MQVPETAPGTLFFFQGAKTRAENNPEKQIFQGAKNNPKNKCRKQPEKTTAKNKCRKQVQKTTRFKSLKIKDWKNWIFNRVQITNHLKNKDMKTELRVVKVTYENGDTITTSMSPNLTNEEILDYFRIGKYFNIGSVEDNMQRVVEAEILR